MKGDERDLVPLRAATLDAAAAAEARTEERLRRAWLRVVGPALVGTTRLLRIHRRTLLIGCWNTEVIQHLRGSAEAVWPQLKERLERQFHLKLQRMEVVPCDPPSPEPVRPPRPEDPLLAVLQRYRALREAGAAPPKGE